MYLTLTEHLQRQAAATPEHTAMIYVTGNTVQRLPTANFLNRCSG